MRENIIRNSPEINYDNDFENMLNHSKIRDLKKSWYKVIMLLNCLRILHEGKVKM